MRIRAIASPSPLRYVVGGKILVSEELPPTRRGGVSLLVLALSFPHERSPDFLDFFSSDDGVFPNVWKTIERVSGSFWSELYDCP